MNSTFPIPSLPIPIGTILSNGSVYTNQTTFPLPAVSVILPLLSLSALLLLIPPLVFHASQRNFGATAMIVWLSLSLVFYIVNPLIWTRDNINDWWDGHVYCDIAVRVQIAAKIGLPGSALVAVKKLAAILKVDEAPPKQTRWSKMFEWTLCLWFPLLIAALYYIVQSNRYTLSTTTGCTIWYERTWVSIVLVLMWPFILAIFNTYLAILVLVRLYRFRKQLSTILHSSHTSKTHLYRLLVISSILTFAIIPVLIVGLTHTFQGGFHAFDWHLIHSDWLIIRYPTNGRLTDWFGPFLALLAYVFFFTFGVGNDALDMYKSWARKAGLDRCFLRLLAPKGSSSTRNAANHMPSLSTWKSGTWDSGKATLTQSTSTALSHLDMAKVDRTRQNSDMMLSPASFKDAKMSPLSPADMDIDLELGHIKFSDTKDYGAR